MGLDKANSEKKIFTSTHDSLYRTSWNMFLDKPILGHGPKLFRVKCKDEKFKVGDSKCHTHPHNFYIQLLAETGIIGFSFLFGLLIYFFYLIYKQVINKYFLKRDFLSDYQICLLAGLLITIWPLIPNGSFFNNHLMLLYSLQIGFFRKKINIKKFGPFYKVEETLKKYINNFKHLIKKI
jgi:O-antigen ligase